MPAFRFVHAADLHLDSPLTGLAVRDGRMAARIRGATREALDMLVEQTIDAGAAFLIIAGDVYDGDWKDFHTGLFFAGQMGRLKAAGVGVYLLHGNHDAESQITRSLTLPDNVHVFPTKSAGSFRLDGLGVGLHGQGFATREVRENLVPSYPEPVAGLFNIGVLHTGLGGRGGHVNYAPCALPELVEKGYDYWALGHVHQREVLHRAPHVIFPGNLQGRHIREEGPKGALLVTVEDGAVTALDDLPCDTVRWARVTVDATAVERIGALHERVREALADGASGREDRLLACRIVIFGRTPLHEQLVAEDEALLAEARAAALGFGDDVAWVERVVLETAPNQGSAPDAEALDDLARLLAEAPEDAELAALLAADPGEMARALRPELRERAEAAELRAALDGDGTKLVRTAGAYLMARLGAGR